MKARLYFIFSVLLLLAAKPAMADKSDTVRGKYKRPVTYSYTESMFAPGNIWAQNGWQNMRTTDTSLNNLEIYDTHYNLGNTGLPYVPVLFNTDLQPMGFYYGQDYISNNFYSDSSIRYFNTRAPYTQFYYVTDPEIHQYFQFTHAQNFGKNLDISLGFKRIRSEGNYVNQSTNLNQLTLDANYHTKHYLAFADIIYEVNKFQQNGGLASDTELASSDYSNRLTAPVNLNYATTEMFEQSFHIQQYYFFGFRTLDSNQEKPLFYVSHSLRIAGHSNVFSDNSTDDSAFFQYSFHSPLTYDSLRYNEFSNDLSVGSASGWTNFLHWEAGIKDQWIHFRDFIGENPQDEYGAIVQTNQEVTDTVFYNLIAHGRIYNSFDSGRILFDASGQYIFSGIQQGDEQSVVQLGFKLDSTQFFKLSGSYSYQTPAYIYELYQGNNLDWLHNISNTTTTNVAFSYFNKKWKLGITLQATQITNLVYFDTNAIPRQYTPTFMVYCAGITKDFKLYKFHWTTSEKLQYVSDNVPLRLPRIVTENSVFYENELFHHALLLRFGADFFYNTAYYGYAYMPITDQYYLENSTKLGNYLYIDPFVSFRIKTFRMFVKMENVTSGYVPYNYYYALHYPITDRVLRFGIVWDFWN
jgi:hypothetical protein